MKRFLIILTALLSFVNTLYGQQLPSTTVEVWLRDSTGTAFSAANPLQVTGGGGGTQYVEGATAASITGTAMMWEDTGDTLTPISAAKPLPVSGTFWQATQPVSGTFWQATQPVSEAAPASRAVTNAGTFATQATLQAGTAEIGKLAAGTAEIGNVKNSGTFAVQSTLQAGTAIAGKFTTDQTTHGTTDKVASDVYVAGAVNSATNPVFTVFPGTLVSGAITSAMTGTTSTSLVGATASNNLYITQCTTSNGSTTVSTDILLQDGSGGTTLYVLPAPAAATATTGGGGGSFSFPVPLKVPTSGNALFAANVTTGSSTKISCSGFRSTVSY